MEICIEETNHRQFCELRAKFLVNGFLIKKRVHEFTAVLESFCFVESVSEMLISVCYALMRIDFLLYSFH